MFKSINPATEQFLLSEQFISDENVRQLVLDAQDGFEFLKSTSLEERCSAVRLLAKVLGAEKKQYANWITGEVGKPILQSLAELDKCIDLCNHFASNASSYLEEQKLDEENVKLMYSPLGVIVGVMPWNFPFWQVFRFVIPTFLAGNSVIIKHAPNVGVCANLLKGLFGKIELLNRSYFNATVSIDQLSDIVSFKEVKGVSLTGSNFAGSSMGEIVGREVKPMVLELGGSDAFVVCEDANMEQVAENAILARLQNNGQSCIAGKRFFIEESCYDEFQNQLLKKLQNVRIGDPKDEGNLVGPLARKDLLDGYNALLEEGVKEGAELIYKKEHSQNTGFYVDVSVYKASNENPLAQNEVFGPCFVLIPYKSKEECLEWVNDSEFGLSASVWTNDANLKSFYINGIESGAVFINKISSSNPRFPFGGVKKSGVGKELGELGIKSFVNQKLVVLA